MPLGRSIFRIAPSHIDLTLNHGMLVVRAAASLAEAEAILSEWQPRMAVVDVDNDDSPRCSLSLAPATSGRPAVSILGLTRRGDLLPDRGTTFESLPLTRRPAGGGSRPKR